MAQLPTDIYIESNFFQNQRINEVSAVVNYLSSYAHYINPSQEELQEVLNSSLKGTIVNVSGQVILRESLTVPSYITLKGGSYIADSDVGGAFPLIRMEKGSTFSSAIVVGNTQIRSNLSDFIRSSGILVLNASGCTVKNLHLSDLGRKNGEGLDTAYAVQIQRNKLATEHVERNIVENVSVDDSYNRLSFIFRLYSDFDQNTGVTPYKCRNNLVRYCSWTGGGFNGVEVVGPDTTNNTIQDIAVELSNCVDVFDFDHGASSNTFERCCVKSLYVGGRTSMNMFSNKETSEGGAVLNLSKHNRFIDCGVDGILVPSGTTVRVFSDLAGTNTSIIRPYIINVSQSEVQGTLSFFERLAATGIPDSVTDLKINEPYISFCSFFLYLSGVSGGSANYNSISISGGNVTTSRAVFTSTTTANFSLVKINDMTLLDILGSSSSDALSLPRATNCSVNNCVIRGATMTGLLLNMGGTFGAGNSVVGNIFISAVGATGSAVQVSPTNSLNVNNVFVNRSS